MFRNVTLKSKIIISVLVLLFISSLSITIGFTTFARKKMTELSITCLERKLSGDIQSSRDYIKTHYGKINLVNNYLVDTNNMPINNRFEMVDEITSKLNVVATIFVKDNDDFTRVLTSIQDDKGNRIVGTKLGSASAAYEPIRKKQTYYGEASILGLPYLTAYDPIFNDKNEVIGILFLGIPIENINTIINQNISSLLVISSVITIAILLIIMAIMLYTINRLFSPFKSLLSMLKDISEGEGDLTKRLSVKNNDELGLISTHFNTFIEKLQKIIGHIILNSSTVASSATELSAVSAQIAANTERMNTQTSTVATATKQTTININSISTAAEEMSVSLNNVATAIEEMSASLNEVSSNCQKELKIAAEADAYSKNCKNVMDKLGVAAKSISKVVEVINDIADQTNLLALNATIEAASAGDAGKGFVIVANEVKELSKQTAQATQEIQKQVEEMQYNTESAVKAIDSVSKVIEDVNVISQTIVSAVEEQSATVKETSKNVSGVNTRAMEVSKNVAESATGLSEVSSTIAVVNSDVADTAKSICQVKSSADELSKLSERLKGLLKQFKI